MTHQDLSKNPLIIGLVAGIVGAFLGFGGLMTAIQNNWIEVSSVLLQNTSEASLFNQTASSISSSFTDVSGIVEKVNPSVVSIVIKKNVPVMEPYQGFDPFREFFGDNSPFHFNKPQYRQNGTEEKEVGGGSGFFISDDGYIVTNAHVVSDVSAKYSVMTNNGTVHDAKVVATDDILDVALIKIDGSNYPVLNMGDSDSLKLGQGVIAIGNALGEFQNTVSTGVVSGLSRSITAGDGRSSEQLENVIQTDAAINPGNSGGPLLDREGNVIGVNVAMAGNSQNIGFSLPMNLVKSSIESMKSNGRVIRPYIGVRYVPVTEELKKINNLTVNYGALVLRGQTQNELAVVPGSPADKAGIVENDILLEVGTQMIDEKHSLASLIRGKQVGDQVDVKVLHKGQEETLKLTLEETPS